MPCGLGWLVTKNLTFGTTQLADKKLLLAALEKVGLSRIVDADDAIYATDKYGYSITLTKTESGYALSTSNTVLDRLDRQHGGNFVAALKRQYNEGMVLKLVAKTKGKIVDRKTAETTKVVIKF